MPAQQPLQDESSTAVSQQTESSNRPRLTKKERASGLLVDIADNFHDGPIKNAVNMPSLGTSFIVLPVIFILTLSAMKSGIMTGGHFFQTKKLEHFGAAAQAMVIDQEAVKKEEKKTEAGEVYITYDYWIVYRFQVLNSEQKKKIFSKREQVSKDLHDQLKVDTPVSVFYDRNNPAVSRIKENYVIFSPLDGEVFPLFSCKGAAGLFLILLFLIFGGAATIGLLFWIVKGIVASVLLHVKGKIATAEIIELEGFDGSNSMKYSMIYRFKPSEANAVITGRQNISKDIYPVCKKRKNVDILYVPRKPGWFKAILTHNRTHTPVSITLFGARLYARISIPVFIIGSIVIGLQLCNIYQYGQIDHGGVVFGFLLIMLSSLAFAWKIILQRRIEKIEQYGMIANAKIIEEDEDVIYYQFNVTSPDGESRSIFAREAKLVPWREPIGATVTVRYLENKPTVFRRYCK